jgi:hypothetical protein
MHGYAIDGRFYVQNFADGVAKGEIMNGISAVQQCAVDIEKIGICSIPDKTWLNGCMADRVVGFVGG